MKQIIIGSCGEMHGPVCPMNKTVETQTYLSLAIVAILIILGIILIFSKPQKEIIIKKVTSKPPKKSYDTSGLRAEDKKTFNLIKENKTIFQGELIEKLGFGKAKVSRILDRLENKDLIERKRRGMTNVVVLKEN
jgi:uncharacterized membrane protein